MMDMGMHLRVDTLCAFMVRIVELIQLFHVWKDLVRPQFSDGSERWRGALRLHKNVCRVICLFQ